MSERERGSTREIRFGVNEWRGIRDVRMVIIMLKIRYLYDIWHLMVQHTAACLCMFYI